MLLVRRGGVLVRRASSPCRDVIESRGAGI